MRRCILCIKGLHRYTLHISGMRRCILYVKGLYRYILHISTGEVDGAQCEAAGPVMSHEVDEVVSEVSSRQAAVIGEG